MSIAPTLDAHYGDKQGLENQHIDGGGLFVAFDLAQITSKANRTRVEPGATASTMNAAGQMHVAGTLGANHGNVKAEAAWTGQLAQSATGVRRLLPVECERLQGFPDNYTLIPYRGKPAADGPRYKALGNSMAVPVMRWIGGHIAMVDAL